MSPLSENVKEVTKGGNPLTEDEKNKLSPENVGKIPVDENEEVTIELTTVKEVDKISVTDTTNVKEVTVTVKDEDGNTVLVSIIAYRVIFIFEWPF